MREQFGVEQRAMLDAVAAVDAIAGAERVEAVLRAGMELARHLHRAAHAHHVERRPPGARQLGIEDAEVDSGIAGPHRRIAENGEQDVHAACKERLVRPPLARERKRAWLRKHITLRVARRARALT